jgi:hypothetical protein
VAMGSWFHERVIWSPSKPPRLIPCETRPRCLAGGGGAWEG